MDLEERMLTFSLARDADDDDLRPSDAKNGHGVIDRREAGAAGSDDDADDDADGVGAHRAPMPAAEAMPDPLRDHFHPHVRKARAVHADRAWHIEQQRRREEMGRLRAAGASESARFASMLAAPSEAEPVPQSTPTDDTDDDTDAADDTNDDDDDAFFASYRAGRLAELHVARAAAAGRAVYGSVVQVGDKFEFLDRVDGLPPAVVAVVLLYQPFLPGCGCMMRHLETVASRFPHVACFSVKSDVLSEGLDPVALPALVLYRATRTLHSTLRVHETVCRGGGDAGEAHVAALVELLTDAGAIDT